MGNTKYINGYNNNYFNFNVRNYNFLKNKKFNYLISYYNGITQVPHFSNITSTNIGTSHQQSKKATLSMIKLIITILAIILTIWETREKVKY